VDTRKLTKKIREFGSMLGRIDLGRDGSDAPPPVPSTPLLSPATSTTSLSSLSLLPSPLPALDDSSAATHLVAQVTCKQIKVYGQGLHPRIIAFDCGMKNNIVRCFVKEQRVQVGQGSHTIYHSIALE
jgi:carbamoylphosphate synthase small subunit